MEGAVYSAGRIICFVVVIMAARLTEKQKRFVSEYLVDLNATKAAGRAGYKDPNIGRQLITKNNISEAIQNAIHRRENRTEVTQDYVIQKLKEIADMAASDAQESDLKYSNKLKAIELLGKHVGAFEKKDGAQSLIVQIIDDM